MLLHLKKVSGDPSSLFPNGYEVVGEPVTAEGVPTSEWKKIGVPVYLKLPSTRFVDRPYQFKTDEVKQIGENTVQTHSGLWQFTVI